MKRNDLKKIAMMVACCSALCFATACTKDDDENTLSETKKPQTTSVSATDGDERETTTQSTTNEKETMTQSTTEKSTAEKSTTEGENVLYSELLAEYEKTYDTAMHDAIVVDNVAYFQYDYNIFCAYDFSNNKNNIIADNVYLSCCANNSIYILEESGNLLTRYDLKGNIISQFETPFGYYLTANSLFILENGNVIINCDDFTMLLQSDFSSYIVFGIEHELGHGKTEDIRHFKFITACDNKLYASYDSQTYIIDIEEYLSLATSFTHFPSQDEQTEFLQSNDYRNATTTSDANLMYYDFVFGKIPEGIITERLDYDLPSDSVQLVGKYIQSGREQEREFFNVETGETLKSSSITIPDMKVFNLDLENFSSHGCYFQTQNDDNETLIYRFIPNKDSYKANSFLELLQEEGELVYKGGSHYLQDYKILNEEYIFVDDEIGSFIYNMQTGEMVTEL